MSGSSTSKRHEEISENDSVGGPGPLMLLSDDLLDKCFSFIGKGYFRYVGGTCRCFRDVYVNGTDQSKVTFWRNVYETVPCAEVWLEDQEKLGRTPAEKQRVIDTIGLKAMGLGNVQVLAWAHRNGFSPRDSHFVAVGESGHVKVLEWARSNNLDWFRVHSNNLDWSRSFRVIQSAIKSGNLNVLDFLFDTNPLVFDKEYFPQKVAETGHIHVLEWTKQKDLLPDTDSKVNSALFAAGRYGHVHAMDWLFEHGCRPSPAFIDSSATVNDINVLRWALDRGICGSDRACKNAAIRGHLNALQLLREYGCPWDGKVRVYAAFSGHRHIVEWARENGCPEPTYEEMHPHEW